MYTYMYVTWEGLMKGQKPDVRVYPITTARKHLFDLVEELLTGGVSRVELSHRDYGEHVVLVRKTDIEGLEADLQAARSQTLPEPRALRGMASLNVPALTAVEQIRGRQTALAAEKRATFGNQPGGSGQGLS
jgi:hypothetical protein